MECSQRINCIQKCPAQKSTQTCCFPFLVVFLFCIGPSAQFFSSSFNHAHFHYPENSGDMSLLTYSIFPSLQRQTFWGVATSCSYHFPVCLASVSNPNPELMPFNPVFSLAHLPLKRSLPIFSSLDNMLSVKTAASTTGQRSLRKEGLLRD